MATKFLQANFNGKNFEFSKTRLCHSIPETLGNVLGRGTTIFTYFSDEQMDGNTQMFVPFCCEVSLSEVDNFDNSDSDCEPDRHGSKTLSPTSR